MIYKIKANIVSLKGQEDEILSTENYETLGEKEQDKVFGVLYKNEPYLAIYDTVHRSITVFDNDKNNPFAKQLASEIE